MMKTLIKRALAWCGYDLRKTSQVGLDALNDVQRILGAHAPQTILDVGAHHGETAVDLARKFPRAAIHSFEPCPATFAELKANVGRFPNVTPVNLALGDQSGRQTLHVNQFSATNSLLAASAQIADPVTRDLLACREEVAIAVTTLDAYCEAKGIAFVDLLKMDVQGFELHVLRGAERFLAAKKVLMIFTEASFEALYEGQAAFTELYARLAAQGFQLVDLYGHTRNARQGIRWCDLLFVNPSALAHAA
jgi:FkbM family methyltransferase